MRWEFKEPQEVWFGGALAGILISLCICSRPLFKWCQLSSFFIETSRASFFLILFGICPFVTLLASFSSLFSFTRRVYSSVASASVLSRIYEHCLTWNPLLGQHPQATVPAIPEVATRGRLCSGCWVEIRPRGDAAEVGQSSGTSAASEVNAECT